MSKLKWFNDVYKRNPKPAHISRIGDEAHDYRIIIVIEDEDMNEVDQMEENETGKIHYAVINESHRRTVKARFDSNATQDAMVFIDSDTGAVSRSSTREITAFRKSQVEDPPTPYETCAEIKVKSVKQPQEVFQTTLMTEVENPRSRTKRTEEYVEPLINIVDIKKSKVKHKPSSASPVALSKETAIQTGVEKLVVNELDGYFYEQLTNALLAAFPTRTELEMMLRFRLKWVLANFVAPEDGLSVAVFKVIKKAEAEGNLNRLITAAHEGNPGNPKLLQLYQERGLASIKPGWSDSDLERLVSKTNPYLSVTQWRHRLRELESQICRIEITSGKSVIYGTGFLLAPDIVMTNYHVVETVIEGKDRSDNVILRFDYKELEDGKTLYGGTEFRLSAQDWLIDHSPNNRSGELPNGDQLDFALLRVDGAPGNQRVGEKVDAATPQRRWIQLPASEYSFEPKTPLFILQHPEGKALQLAFDTDSVIGLNSNNTRVRYKTNTERGSSGSPCFNANWELVALHHSGDPNFALDHQPEYNEGIPINAIRSLLEQRNLTSLFG